MRRLGEVVRTAQGLAIVRCADDDPPRIGTAAIDDGLQPVGRVVDVFGSVERPYLAITPEGDHPAMLLGSVVYAR